MNYNENFCSYKNYVGTFRKVHFLYQKGLSVGAFYTKTVYLFVTFIPKELSVGEFSTN